MEEWFQAHARHHEAILKALHDTKGLVLDNLGLYPVNQNSLSDWLRRHQQMHSAMTQATGVTGTDLSILDLKNKSRSDVWFFQHFIQHQAVGQSCGQPI